MDSHASRAQEVQGLAFQTNADHLKEEHEQGGQQPHPKGKGSGRTRDGHPGGKPQGASKGGAPHPGPGKHDAKGKGQSEPAAGKLHMVRGFHNDPNHHRLQKVLYDITRK